jgi:hypothetical protein
VKQIQITAVQNVCKATFWETHLTVAHKIVNITTISSAFKLVQLIIILINNLFVNVNIIIILIEFLECLLNCEECTNNDNC